MATYYVDFEAGTGDGTAANTPAKDWNSISPTPAGTDTIKVKGSPNPTLLGTANAKMGWGHAMWNASTNTLSNFNFSTTAGESTCTINSSNAGGSMVGETIECEGWALNQGNFNGMWKIGDMVGSMSGNSATYKIEEFQATSAGGSSGTIGTWWPATAKVLYLNSTPIKALASTGPRTNAWTAATNVTCTLDHNNSPEWSGSRRNFEHSCSDKIEIGADHETGLAAYYPITSLTDSQYEQISFQMTQISGTKTDGISLRLCTGSDGTGSVKSIPIDFTLVNNNWNWTPFVKDFEEALTSGGNINSVALYVDTDEGARTFHISNVIACKASDQDDSVTHQSLIGWNTTADPMWRTPCSIRDLPDGKTRIEFYASNIRNEPTGYNGAGRTAGFAADYTNANLYKRETIKVNDATLNANLNGLSLNTQGGVNNPLTISGGWNSTFDTQNLDHSLLDFRYWRSGLSFSYKNDVFIEKLGQARFRTSTLFFYGNRCSVDDIILTGLAGFYFGGSFYKLKVYGNCFSGSYWLNLASFFAIDSNGDNATSADKANFEAHVSGGGSSSNDIRVSTTGNLVFNKLVSRGTYYNGYGLYFDAGIPTYIDTLELTSKIWPTAYNFGMNTLNIDNIILKNCARPFGVRNKSDLNCTTFTYSQTDEGYKYSWSAEALEIFEGSKATITNGPTIVDKKLKITDGTLFTENDSITGDYSSSPIAITSGSWHKRTAGGVSGAIENFYGVGLISPNQSTRKTASGYSWKFATQNFSNASSGNPIKIDLGSIAVNASSQVTIGVWCYRTHASIIGRIKVKLNTLIGLSSDTTAVTSGSINTWEQISVSFTPSASGYVDVVLEAYDGPGYDIYFDDVTATQA